MKKNILGKTELSIFEVVRNAIAPAPMKFSSSHIIWRDISGRRTESRSAVWITKPNGCKKPIKTYEMNKQQKHHFDGVSRLYQGSMASSVSFTSQPAGASSNKIAELQNLAKSLREIREKSLN